MKRRHGDKLCFRFDGLMRYVGVHLDYYSIGQAIVMVAVFLVLWYIASLPDD